MGNFNNIEDFFKNKFDGAQATPSSNLWDNIEKSLESEVFFEKKFKDFKVQPNSNIWINIQKKLNYIDFMRFGLARFNVYYLSLLLISFSLFFIALWQQGNVLTGMSINSDLEKFEKLRPVLFDSGYIAEHKNFKTNTEITADRENDVVSDLLNKVLNDKNTGTTVPAQEPENEDQNIPVLAEVNKISTKSNNINTESNQNDINAAPYSDINSNTYYDNHQIIPRYNYHLALSIDNTTDQLYYQPLPFNTANHLELLSENAHVKTTNLLTPDNIYLEYHGPEILQRTQKELEIVDLERNDTLCKNAFGEDIIIPRSRHSIDIFYSPAFTTAIFNVSNPEMPYFLNEFKESHNPLMSDNFGVHYNYEYKKFRLQTGLQFSQYNQEFLYAKENIGIDTSYMTNEILYEFIVNDTVWFIDMNHFNQTGQLDSIAKVIPVHADSVHVISVAQYDTSITTEAFKSVNRYKYVELPLIAGYRLGNSKIGFTPKAGIIAGLLISSSGKTYDYSDNNQIIDLGRTKQPYIKPNFSYLVGLEIDYKVNNILSVVIDPYYRQGINSIFEKSYPVNQRFSAYGIKMGIRYNF